MRRPNNLPTLDELESQAIEEPIWAFSSKFVLTLPCTDQPVVIGTDVGHYHARKCFWRYI